jgi:hypothetical protein
VTVVTAEERRREIARLLGDQDLEVALRHATELLKTGGTSSAGRSGTPSSPARPPRGR